MHKQINQDKEVYDILRRLLPSFIPAVGGRGGEEGGGKFISPL